MIDSVGCGFAGWEIDLSELAIAQKKAVEYASGIDETPHDVATIIETKNNGIQGPGEIDLGEGQFILMAAPVVPPSGFVGN